MKKKLIASIIMYTISVLIFMLYLYVELKPNNYTSTLFKLIMLCSTCLFVYIGSLLLSKYRGDNKPMKVSLWIFFILYMFLFITLTLFDPMFGRLRGGFVNSKEIFDAYIKTSFNIIPFKTILEYLGLFNSLIDTSTLVVNLIGNFACLMPLAFFLLLLFKKQEKFKIFLITSIILILGIEIIQFITLSGSCDIDDIILNVSGASLAYWIIKADSVNCLIKNIFLLEKNKIKVNELIKIITACVLSVILLILLILIRENIYKDNFNKEMEKYNYSIEIIDESQVCAQALEKFYETQLYEYYFSCIKSDAVYAKINGEKYLVKDLLNNNPTKYQITIDRLAEAGLSFFIEEKYKYIELKEKGQVGFNPRIDNKKIIDVQFGKSEIDENTSTKLYIIPKEPGETILSIEVVDIPSDHKYVTKKYKINVSHDLDVTITSIK